MRISLSACMVAALCLVASVTARPPPEAAETTDKECLEDHTYKTMVGPVEFVEASVKYASTSAGYLCCDLCHRSNTNCMWAVWNKNDNGTCVMSINTSDSLDGDLGTEPTKKKKEICPLGVLEEGFVQDRVYDDSAYYVGPCWRKNDWRDVPGFLKWF